MMKNLFIEHFLRDLSLKISQLRLPGFFVSDSYFARAIRIAESEVK